MTAGRWVTRIERVMTALDTAMGLAGGGLFFVVAWYIVFDVLGRNYTGFYSGATDELSGYALAIGTSWAMAFALRRKGHVAIDVVTAHLPARPRALLELGALVVMLMFAALVARFSWGLAIGSAVYGERSVGMIGTPLMLPQSLMAIGFTVLAIEALVMLVVGLVRLVAAPSSGTASQSGREHS